jgi:alpha-glucosidase
VTLRTAAGRWLSLHEAALVDYSELTLRPLGGASLRAHLWPWPDGVAVKGATPLVSPWRTIQVADRLGALAESHLIQNLNAPCVLDDTSFIEPMTFIGIWWGLHTGRWTWSAGPRHGATTERALEYLAFAARHGIGGVLVEGWNLGWETWGAGESQQDYLTPYPDFDLEAVARAADSLGVELIGHHETGGNVPMYEAQLEDALALYARHGVTSVKTGYAGPIRPEGMHHHGQYMVRHFQRVVEAAARHRVTLNVHEGIKPTGLERTWPNLMCTEAVRGTEWNATLNTIPPRHATVLPFTRLLAGPADVTPGIFRLDHAPERGRRVATTLANQLALYVVLHGPLMMLADLPEHYEGRPAFRFLQQVPVTWDETRVLEADMGRHVTVARRRGEHWYLGSITDHDPRPLAIPLRFLDTDRPYLAEVYADAPGTDWQQRPDAIEIGRYRATAADTLHAVLSRAGGLAVRLTPAVAADLEGVADLVGADATASERLMRFTALAVPGEHRKDHLAVGTAVTLQHPPRAPYDQGALTDGRLAGAGYKDPAWLGFEGDDLVASLDLADLRDIATVVLRVLHDPVSWIMTPSEVVVEASADGQAFAVVARLEPAAGDDQAIRELRLDLGDLRASALRITARQRPLPVGHPGYGSSGWLFIDELIVNPEG